MLQRDGTERQPDRYLPYRQDDGWHREKYLGLLLRDLPLRYSSQSSTPAIRYRQGAYRSDPERGAAGQDCSSFGASSHRILSAHRVLEARLRMGAEPVNHDDVRGLKCSL